LNTLDILKYGHEWVLKHLEDMEETEWLQPNVCGVWSVKDIIAHLASFEFLLNDSLDFVTKGETGSYLTQMGTEGGGVFNDKQVAARDSFSVSKVLTEYEDIQNKVYENCSQIAKEQLTLTGSIPWYGMEYDLEDFIVYANYGHKREHCAQIAVYRDTLGKTVN